MSWATDCGPPPLAGASEQDKHQEGYEQDRHAVVGRCKSNAERQAIQPAAFSCFLPLPPHPHHDREQEDVKRIDFGQGALCPEEGRERKRDGPRPGPQRALCEAQQERCEDSHSGRTRERGEEVHAPGHVPDRQQIEP